MSLQRTVGMFRPFGRIVARSGRPTAIQAKRFFSSDLTDAEFDEAWEKFFKREDLDNYQMRRGLDDLFSHDLIPEPRIIVAALHCSRRLNDFATTVRILEGVKDKSTLDPSLYDWVLGEIKPTLQELGVPTPEELGLDASNK
eukprot:Clim_evm49s207 gene=Clim_evmTU49s207